MSTACSKQVTQRLFCKLPVCLIDWLVFGEIVAWEGRDVLGMICGSQLLGNGGLVGCLVGEGVAQQA